MLSLVDYASSSEEEGANPAGEKVSEPSLLQPITTGTIEKDQKKKKKKKKKALEKKVNKSKLKKRTITTSFLPPEIQAALARGDTLNDTDSENEGPGAPPAGPSIHERSRLQSSDLLARLPAPAAARAAADALESALGAGEPPAGGGTENKRKEKKKKKKKSKKQDKGKQGVEEETVVAEGVGEGVSLKKGNTAVEAAVSKKEGGRNGAGAGANPEREDSDSEDEGLDLLAIIRKERGLKSDAEHMEERQQTQAAPAPMVFRSLLSGIQAAPAVNAGTAAAAAAAAAAGDEEADEVGALPGTVAVPGGQRRPQHPNAPSSTASSSWQAPPPSASYSVPEQHGSPFLGENEGGRKRRRARDWEVEAQVMSGCTSGGALDTYGAGAVTDVAAAPVDAYNPLRQGPSNQAQSVKIKAGFYNPSTGQVEATDKPSKLQKRKHQINQLAFNAAERELELLDRRGQGMLTKAQTQAKYGW